MKKFFTFFAAVLFAGSMMAADLYTIDFTQGQGEWTINNVELGGLEFVWAQSQQYGMKATGYVDGNHATESWLVSPAIDLSGVEAAKVAFSHARKYGSLDQLAVKASADGQNWTDLEVSAWPDGTSWNYIDAEADLSAFAGNAVYVAFVYTSTTSGGATWEIKTVAVSDDGEITPVVVADVTFLGSDFEGQGTESSGSLVTATKGGVTFTCNKGYSDDAHSTLRCYKNGVITITSETEQIGKLVFQFYQTYTGDLETEVVVNANEWNYTLTNQARIEKLEIYFGEYEPVVVEIDTIDVAQAIALAEALQPEKGKSLTTDKKYAVKGFIVGTSTTKQNTWYMADEVGAYGNFQAYQCASVDYAVAEGDLVIVTGKIMHYYGEGSSGEYHNYEISGGALTHVYAEGIENIKLTEKAHKIVVDGMIYIVRDGKMFNLQGAQVR